LVEFLAQKHHLRRHEVRYNRHTDDPEPDCGELSSTLSISIRSGHSFSGTVARVCGDPGYGEIGEQNEGDLEEEVRKGCSDTLYIYLDNVARVRAFLSVLPGVYPEYPHRPERICLSHL
jgi:hypothetical protein